MASSLAEQTEIERKEGSEDGSDIYQSRFNPERMGNNQPIAYGGCTIGTAIRAAVETVPDNLHLFSAQGIFLGPSLTDRKYILRVTRYRDTKSFATRQVEVSQRQNNGTLRSCMVVIADFQTREPQSVLEYSTPPSQSLSSVENSMALDDIREDFVQQGHITHEQAQAHARAFSLAGRLWESRQCKDSFFAQTLYGMVKTAKTSQDSRPLVDRITAEWFRSRHPLNTQAENLGALGLITDAAVAFMPLTHSHMYLDDVGACSTLEFSLRVMVNDIDLNDWNLKELKTHSGGNGRTFSSCTVWNHQEKCIAHMSQQSILRPRPTKAIIQAKM